MTFCQNRTKLKADHVLNIDIITLFPEMFTPLESSILGKARQKDLWDYNLIQLRDFAINDYGTVDDAPYGGEAGMVLRPEPLYDALKSVQAENKQVPVIFPTPQGKVFNQQDACELAEMDRAVILCGHYKGIDERIRQECVTHEFSIGDYVLTGGEIPAMVMLDAVVRLIPGAMGNRVSAENDSHYNGLLAWPLYTRPETFREKKVPDILLSGHHAKIEQWQKEESLKRTQERRPDLYKNFNTRE
jgi:tRNA (guanine37-N1)-methyltransferase